jgi:hypothetical protein
MQLNEPVNHIKRRRPASLAISKELHKPNVGVTTCSNKFL